MSGPNPTPKQPFDKPDIAIVGELNPDLILYGLAEDLPLEQEHLASGFSMTLGSSSAILAHNLSILGSRVSFTAELGDDLFGEFCSSLLLQAGVELHIVPSRTPHIGTGATVILPHATGRHILTYPGTMAELSRADLAVDDLARARHFHLSSLFLQRKLMPDTPQLFADLKQRGLTTSLDTNDDPEDRWGPPFGELLPHVNVLFCNQRELERMTGISDGVRAGSKMADRVALVIVKHGANGAFAFTSDGITSSPGVPVPEVVDTVGAGDSFAAGFLHQWLRGSSLQDCLAFGNRTGALSVTRAGGVQAFRESAHVHSFLRSSE